MGVREAAKGKWFAILNGAGLHSKYLNGRHGPCPFCEGTDRFRWDNKDNRGTYYCTHCGAGDGIQLLMAFKDWDYGRAARYVEGEMGSLPSYKTTASRAKPSSREYLSKVYRSMRTITMGTETARYLAARGIQGLNPVARANLFHVNDLRLSPTEHYPAMIGLVKTKQSDRINIHRTWFRPNDHIRKTGPGEMPEGCAIQLGPVRDTLAVAEGIETALSFMQMTGISTWATVSSGLMAKWAPPEGVKRVIIAADHDQNYVGQAAGYALASRLSLQGYEVEVKMPNQVGDWNDVRIFDAK